MAGPEAMRAALDLYFLPSHLRLHRLAPVPGDVHDLLLIATGDEVATRSTALILERSAETLKRAARFYIEEVLLEPHSDSYRVFGLDHTASPDALRRNMALLILLLHPDHQPDALGNQFATRINLAWDDLKTPERRTQYDARLRAGHTPPAVVPGSSGDIAGWQKIASRRMRHRSRHATVRARVVDWLRRRAYGTPP